MALLGTVVRLICEVKPCFCTPQLTNNTFCDQRAKAMLKYITQNLRKNPGYITKSTSMSNILAAAKPNI